MLCLTSSTVRLRRLLLAQRSFFFRFHISSCSSSIRVSDAIRRLHVGMLVANFTLILGGTSNDWLSGRDSSREPLITFIPKISDNQRSSKKASAGPTASHSSPSDEYKVRSASCWKIVPQTVLLSKSEMRFQGKTHLGDKKLLNLFFRSSGRQIEILFEPREFIHSAGGRHSFKILRY